MKIQVMSDLHIQHWRPAKGLNWFYNEFPGETRTDADVLVLAGDVVDLRPRDLLWSKARLLEFGARYKNVIFVPGNHEFYGTGIDEALADLYEMEANVPGLRVLGPGRTITIDGQRFLGGTLWWPLPLPDEFPPEISDHHCITDLYPEAPYQYQMLKSFLEQELRSSDIVVTHHAPSEKSIDTMYAGDPANHWFVAPEMEKLIVERQPRLWIHGHVHSCWDYRIGDTRVVCNAMGYPGEGVKFNPKMVVEV